MIFIPTYLYIKQHTITGKLYFGKTTSNEDEMIKYKGSGKHWKSHIKMHGKENVVTLWYQLYDNPFDLVADALSMSYSFDIVNSNSWLNLQNENGLNGGDTSSHINYNTRKSFKGNHNPMYGRIHSKETRTLMSKANIGKIISDEQKQIVSHKLSKLISVITPDGDKLMNITIRELSDRYELNLYSARTMFAKYGKYKGFVLTNHNT